jgi:hypothetical protein
MKGLLKALSTGGLLIVFYKRKEKREGFAGVFREGDYSGEDGFLGLVENRNGKWNYAYVYANN